MSQTLIQFPTTVASDGHVVVGHAFQSFCDNVAPESARDRLLENSVAILNKCALNLDDGQVTGIVVGQIQSGKTMAYEGLISLAHDSGFPLVIVISGISNPLLKQGIKRLRSDLSRASSRSWAFLKNPHIDDPSSADILKKTLEDWTDDDVPVERRKTVVVSVLKHHGQLLKLTELLESLNWGGFPVLIIDDEADQASLNTLISRKRESSTYKILKSLRDVFPTLSYIQFTATPQAPLLINIADALSPSFVYVLQAGEGYTGGRAFFTAPAPHIRTIPPADIPASQAVNIERPGSLTEALQLFFLGLAYSLSDEPSENCRSMLIHPSQTTDPHTRFTGWVKRSQEEWISILRDEENNPEDFEALLSDFEQARIDLLRTQPGLPSVRSVVKSLKYALRHTLVIEMNTTNGGKTPEVPWEDAPGFVLVGGQAMDRGFTLKGLTVTYMPRSLGVGNADTIQQRARFFGYKASYLGFCRVYLEAGLRGAFEKYVEHEADIRSRLTDVQKNGIPLHEWRRAFLLDTMMRPTRTSVLDKRALGDQVSDEWRLDDMPALDEEIIEPVRSIVASFVSQLSFGPDSGHPDRTVSQKHLLAEGVPLRSAVDLLAAIPSTDAASSLRMTGMVVQLEAALEENPDELCDVYSMRPSTSSTRTLAANDRIKQLFQGPNPQSRTYRKGDLYPGDREIKNDDRVTLQIHSLELADAAGTVRATKVPVVATWVPSRLANGWYVQEV